MDQPEKSILKLITYDLQQEITLSYKTERLRSKKTTTRTALIIKPFKVKQKKKVIFYSNEDVWNRKKKLNFFHWNKKNLGQDSQNFLSQICLIFVTL